MFYERKISVGLALVVKGHTNRYELSGGEVSQLCRGGVGELGYRKDVEVYVQLRSRLGRELRH